MRNQRSRRQNNFNLLRIIAAIAVLVSHAYPIALGPGTPEPLAGVLGINLGELAVLMFFAISGYFISQSFHNKHSTVEFVVARFLRIYPGLLAVLFLSVFALGPFFTRLSLASYFSDHQTLLYIPRNLRLWPMQYDLPGVFEDHGYQAVNGSLWTLVYEVACYAMVVIVGVLGLAPNRRRFAAFLLVYFLCYVAAFPLLRMTNHDHFLRHNIHLLSLPFVIGMALFHFRQHIPLRFPILIGLGSASVISHGSPWFHELFVLTLSYCVFYLGFLQCEPLLAYNRLGDYSYGTYIYAWPIEQVVVAVCKGCSPTIVIILALPLTLLFALLSWHLIEELSLAQKSIASTWLRARVRGGFSKEATGNGVAADG
jgi:peptidoglycan/LPS O-acetylase OafA/YrhL